MKKVFVLVLLTSILINACGCVRAPGNAICNAAQKGNLKRVKSLLKKNPKLLNAKNFVGYAPIHCAAKWKHEEMLKYLIDKGADVNLKNKTSLTPLHMAIMKGHTEIAKILIKNKANVNVRDRNQSTPLHHAAYFGRTKIAKLLVENGADINAKAKNGKTPVDIAKEKNNKGVVEALEKMKKDKQAPDAPHSTEKGMKPSNSPGRDSETPPKKDAGKDKTDDKKEAK